MKNIVCTIAKREEKYIDDFCKYHLNLGFDEIHIYDNDPEFPLFKYYENSSNIIVHKWADTTRRPQINAYRDCIKNIEYNWCAFIDVDEFITLKNFNNISDFLKSFDPKVKCIHLYERVFGDENLIEPLDPTIPIYNRILTPSNKYILVYYKNIVKKDAVRDFKNAHAFTNDIITANSDNKIVNYRKTIGLPKDFVEGNAYIRHYMTKTLSEFCDQKLDTPRVFDQTKKRTIDYFFKVNAKTPEKIEYLKNRGIDL